MDGRDGIRLVVRPTKSRGGPFAIVDVLYHPAVGDVVALPCLFLLK
jgi:hypothetical protein